jgi:hypothetical protein
MMVIITVQASKTMPAAASDAHERKHQKQHRKKEH